ncbi:PH domain-containing protein [Vibrio caribbeanicus]|uniref:PH domain-containing protein n=1 Tax=Vibrio caribbeanicus TaxID=701175 RepID=UPI0013022EF2|nr:PH domain-containing protein [Vibrio caribbeanicus]
MNENLSEETLLSLLLLPTLYVLREAGHIFDPLSVKVEINRDRVSVTRGICTRIQDTLEYKNIENTEITTTLLGKICDYSTIRFYSPGGNVEIPYVYKAKKIVVMVEKLKKIKLDLDNEATGLD